MKPSFLTWFSKYLTSSRTRPDYHDAMRTSDELVETKRALVRFMSDPNADHIDNTDKVVHIRRNVLERSILGNREDQGS